MILRKQCLLPLHNSSSSTAVTIGFTTTTYNVTEFGSASVSVSVLSGTLARDVVVTLQTEDGTATGRAVVICLSYFFNQMLPLSNHSHGVVALPLPGSSE